MKRIALLVLIAATAVACNRESFEEGDIIEDAQGEITNGERLYEFYEHTENGEEDAVRVISYTTEGDPIYHDLHFDGNKIESVEDNREDQFSSEEVVIRQCESILILTSETEAIYVLRECDPESGWDTILHETW
ncbi:DUF4362 domain-containing protein [Microbacterium sp. APC 3898]|uniref:DUF4362 domain-containing protein n=1 Tax=Planococcus notacanthi TaxID=3035188 RepID=A0ABT7ZK20_9BACL|nr:MULTISPECIES: DUF4362 domain-containing protein [Terrabacteria group]MBF6633099.1 DUF4362 domain-containing protein [Planococcus sp. (in: firmicutes)]MDN3427032.1 DUF4362 domain-containing protein [Planococcus sp. APC 4016]MDN3439587.1 DUF4362 domain-containing protein [Planococcus sp. APC 3900]MDN3499820.1 DUF4362 domain-containing protein [Microbacterium sp. APC 3898]